MKTLNLTLVFFAAGLIWGCSKNSSNSVKPSTSTSTSTSTNSLMADSVTIYAGLLNPQATAINGPLKTAEFSGPVGMAQDASGNLYVAEFNSGDIRKISSNGMVSTLSTGIDMPEYLAFDASGNLYVTFGQIDKVSSSGMLTQIGNSPFFGLTADNNGNIFAATATQIMKLDPSSGKMVAFAGSTTSGSADGAVAAATFTSITALTADKNGNLYAVDGTSVRVINIAKGQVQTMMYKGANPFANPQGIAVDQWDNVYVANYGMSNVANGSVVKITPDGTVSTFAGNGQAATTASSLRGAPQSVSFYGASGIMIMPSGNMLVSSYGNVIQEIHTHQQQQ